MDTRALTAQMTAAFRYAARIYLCTLVPCFDREAPQIVQLLEKLTACLEGIPAGAHGFDRSLVWVLLIGGSVAGPRRRFRTMLADRAGALGEDSAFGSFGRMVQLLQEVWSRRDAGHEVEWRDVMQSQGWEYLLV